jgi:hypothetical protein
VRAGNGHHNYPAHGWPCRQSSKARISRGSPPLSFGNCMGDAVDTK